MTTFADKSVLITGASSGLGEALARRFGRDGARLVLVARRAERLQILADELATPGAGRPLCVAGDLVEAETRRRAVEAAVMAYGGVEVLVNNAGVGEYGAFAGQDAEALRRCLDLNCGAVVDLTRRVLPGMLAQCRGWVLNIASMAAFVPLPYMAVYAAAKGFVVQFSAAVRAEAAARGVVISCCCPGTLKTEFFDHGGFGARRADIRERGVDPAWVADLCARELARGTSCFIPGRLNALGMAMQRLVPRGWLVRKLEKYLRPTAADEPARRDGPS